MTGNTKTAPREKREPITNTGLLMSITIGIFIAMYVTAMAVFRGGFLKPQQIFDMLNENAFLIIVSCGLTVVMITGSIDISVGGVTALVTMVCVMILNGSMWPEMEMSDTARIACAASMALCIGLMFGAVQGALIAYLDIQPFIITLAGMFFARGMITIISVQPQKATGAIAEMLQDRLEIPFLGSPNKKGVMIPAKMEIGVIIALSVVLLIFLLLRWSRLGRGFYAVGGNRQSALMLGINVRRTRFTAHLISGLLAGIAGFVFTMHTCAGNATNATASEMNAIASSIIGGTLLSGGVGNVIGTLFGVLTLTTIKSIVTVSGLRDPWWQSITTGAMLCFFILLQSVVLSRRGRKKRLTDQIAGKGGIKG